MLKGKILPQVLSEFLLEIVQSTRLRTDSVAFFVDRHLILFSKLPKIWGRRILLKINIQVQHTLTHFGIHPHNLRLYFKLFKNGDNPHFCRESCDAVTGTAAWR